MVWCKVNFYIPMPHSHLLSVEVHVEEAGHSKMAMAAKAAGNKLQR